MDEDGPAAFSYGKAQEPESWLLQLPDPALRLVLQQLDPCSLACTAVTCKALSQAAPAVTASATVQSRTKDEYRRKADSFALWLAKHSKRLDSLTQCSVQGCDRAPLTPILANAAHGIPSLSCPKLEQLVLKTVHVQLEATSDCAGVLHDCTKLTALDLNWCVLTDAPAAAAAIASLPNLRNLKLTWIKDKKGRYLVPELRLFSKLTCFCFDGRMMTEQLVQLSGLVNLEHLALPSMDSTELVGGVPSQLVKLTHLDLGYKFIEEGGETQQLQHLSCLTVLRELSIKCQLAYTKRGLGAGNVPGIERLSQLTHFELKSRLPPAKSYFMDLSSSSSSSSCHSWARLTALQSLSLEDCMVQPNALGGCTQLRALSLKRVKTSLDASLQGLFDAVAKLSRLTELAINVDPDSPIDQGLAAPPPPAASFTALTASSNLCSLRLEFSKNHVPEGFGALVRPGALYPHMRLLELAGTPTSEQQLQQICSCCPVLDSVSVVLPGNASAPTMQPLLQLSALTHLEVALSLLSQGQEDADAAAAAAAVTATVGVAARLTGLKHLGLGKITWEPGPHPIGPALLPLTALKALQKLQLSSSSPLGSGFGRKDWWVELDNKASWGNPPDVWEQLQRRLLR